MAQADYQQAMGDLVRKVSRIPAKIKQHIVTQQMAAIPLSDIEYRAMTREDIPAIAKTFASWGKTRSQFEKYLDEQEQEKRLMLIAYRGARAVGYATVIWNSPHEKLAKRNVPEIMDLNVISDQQGQGVGSGLIQKAEEISRQRNIKKMGISPFQGPDYEKPNRLYPKLGYVLIGEGVDQPGNLPILHLVKDL